MALITGVLADYERKALATSAIDRHPVIEFHPSGPGLKRAGGVVFATRVVSALPAVSTGAWEADLELTSLIQPEVWYEVLVTWLDDAGNFVSVDRLPGRLYVDSPGLFVDKYRSENAPWYAWVDADAVIPPEGAHLGDWVLDPVSGDLFRVA
ncbi:hypothetical protein [Microbacterium sp. 2RAF4]|uniref:hypothetical protein n=1 Tax=Microbacterium sp. 2RAF4 TaxID=3232999 RepID=UPI003F95CBB6